MLQSTIASVGVPDYVQFSEAVNCLGKVMVENLGKLLQEGPTQNQS